MRSARDQLTPILGVLAGYRTVLGTPGHQWVLLWCTMALGSSCQGTGPGTWAKLLGRDVLFAELSVRAEIQLCTQCAQTASQINDKISLVLSSLHCLGHLAQIITKFPVSIIRLLHTPEPTLNYHNLFFFGSCTKGFSITVIVPSCLPASKEKNLEVFILLLYLSATYPYSKYVGIEK